MPRGAALEAGIVARILASPYRLTLVFPVPTVSSLDIPTNPFGGSEPEAIPDATVRPTPRIVPCLWTDAGRPGQLQLSDERTRNTDVGWVTDATAMARVLISDIALDVADPHGRTYFDSVEWVEFGTKRYQVLATTPVNASFLVPKTYSVWVKGVQQQ